MTTFADRDTLGCHCDLFELRCLTNLNNLQIPPVARGAWFPFFPTVAHRYFLLDLVVTATLPRRPISNCCLGSLGTSLAHSDGDNIIIVVHVFLKVILFLLFTWSMVQGLIINKYIVSWLISWFLIAFEKIICHITRCRRIFWNHIARLHKLGGSASCNFFIKAMFTIWTFPTSLETMANSDLRGFRRQLT